MIKDLVHLVFNCLLIYTLSIFVDNVRMSVFLMKICKKTRKKRVFYSFLVNFSEILRFFDKKGTVQRVKCFVVGGPQLFASF